MSTGKTSLSCREFPWGQAGSWEVLETMCPTGVYISGETEVGGMWVLSPGET